MLAQPPACGRAATGEAGGSVGPRARRPAHLPMQPPGPEPSPPPLRIGVLVDGPSFRAWQADTVRAMLAVPGVEPVAMIVDARPRAARSTAGRIRRLVTGRHRIWDLYNNGWVGRRAACLRRVPIADVAGPVARVDVVVDRQGWSERFPADALAEVRALRLDVLLRFGFGILRGEILEVPTHGVWSFHHDDEEVYRGSPPAFWELVDDQPVTGAILQRLTDRLDGGRVLAKGWFRTVRHSYVRNTDQVHFGGSPWPAALCRALLAGDAAAADGTPSPSTAPIYKKPTDPVALRFLGTQAARAARAQVDGVVRADHWEVGLVRAPIHEFLDPAFVPRVEWLGLGAPRTHYAADPFALATPTGPLVLYERYDRARRTGTIWEARPGLVAAARPAGLPVAAHASYPYTFEHDGRRYCVPQVAGEPPRCFERDGIDWIDRGPLLDEPVLDPTLVHHDDRWWLFATRPGRGSLTHLDVWFADDLAGPWRPHRGNPVKSDVRSARPAGTPFVHGGALFRPAQDCAAGYGAAVALCEVVELTPDRFREVVRTVVRPQPSWPCGAGLHTLSAAGDDTLLDARRAVFDRHEARVELRSRLRRARG